MKTIKPKSKPEETLALHLRADKLPAFKRNYKFHPSRKWMIDFAWPDLKIAVEVEGGTYSQGRHVRAQGFEDDCEKYNAMVEMGWTLYRYTSRMVQDGRAIDQIRRVIL
jgi:very-short-patch-repair endonuclease